MVYNFLSKNLKFFFKVDYVRLNSKYRFFYRLNSTKFIGFSCDNLSKKSDYRLVYNSFFYSYKEYLLCKYILTKFVNYINSVQLHPYTNLNIMWFNNKVSLPKLIFKLNHFFKLRGGYTKLGLNTNPIGYNKVLNLFSLLYFI